MKPSCRLPLNQVVGKKIKEGDEAEVKLEIVADGHYLTPWSDRAKMSNPLVIEAKIKDDGFIPNPTLKTQLVVSEDGARQTTTVKEDVKAEEDLTDKIVDKLSEKFADLIKPKVEVTGGKMEVIEENSYAVSAFPIKAGRKPNRNMAIDAPHSN